MTTVLEPLRSLFLTARDPYAVALKVRDRKKSVRLMTQHKPWRSFGGSNERGLSQVVESCVHHEEMHLTP